MPELPEVEALVRFLDERSRQAVIVSCQLASISALKTFDPPLEALAGRQVTGWHRRGKYLVMGAGETRPRIGTAEPGANQLWLVVHLARGGWVHWWDVPPKTAVRLGGRSPLALRVTFEGGQGERDERGFDVTEMGTEKRLALWVARRPADVEGVAGLGPDPLDPGFDRNRLQSLLSSEKGTVKNALSRQSLVAGIGNAYSDEILHAARLSPFKPARGLSDEELDRLYAALRQVLGEAVDRAVGLGAAELKGDKHRAMRVHGRTGERCPVCGDVVRQVAFATLSLQYCATCQTGGKPLADRRLSRLVK